MFELQITQTRRPKNDTERHTDGGMDGWSGSTKAKQVIIVITL